MQHYSSPAHRIEASPVEDQPLKSIEHQDITVMYSEGSLPTEY